MTLWKVLLVVAFSLPSLVLLTRYRRRKENKPPAGTTVGILLATVLAAGYIVYLMMKNLFF